ncbi:DNA polymerase I [Advenella alkanexedens]|uniref:DNA polymerase I n=1 Tax=Advenella alkanexedens TaxID=1481665 RepID=A0ABS6NMN4_9BURK|nr:DNA polymerase I [Advenella alkanexedens]MBV4396891.1 DNA polymerase I [Advenella alkanexedens]
MKKTLLLVDGSSYLYRAFHAMPDLRNALGEPTGAIYGVINMMRKINQDYQADYVACIFDAKGKTFRDDLYPEYKGHRPPMPDDLALQIAPIHKAISAMGWPVIAKPGVEADDIIATLAEIATQNDVKTIISTGDKDIAQLVNGHVSIVNTMTNETLDVEGVKSKFGVLPEQIIDYLMLIGDSVDNVPGVPKVGPKTAVKWLSEYGSLDKLVENADKIKGVVGNNLREAIPNFALTRRLITIKRDCEIDDFFTDMSDLARKPQDSETLREIYDHFGFRTWLRELTGDDQAVPQQDARVAHDIPEAPETVDYVTVDTPELLEDCLAQIQAASLVALDTETTSLDPMVASLVGTSMSIHPGQGWYIPLAHKGNMLAQQLDKAMVLEKLRPWLEDDNAAKVLQNAKYDTHVFANEGIALKGIQDDTMLMAYVLESHRSVGMQDLAQRYLGRKGVDYTDLCGKGARQIGFDEVEIEKASFYACEDTDFTLQLAGLMRPLVVAEEGLDRIYRLEMWVSEVLAKIERNGVKIDEKALQQQSHEIGLKLLELENKAYELAGQPFNLNSPKQLAEILFERMQLPVIRKTPKGAPSTDEEVLTKLAQDYPLPATLLEYRGLAKLKSTYTDKLPKMINPKTGRVHTNYAQAAVITGRLASSDPNLQNIPVRTEEGRRVRTAFVPEKGGVIMSADYSQIELRVMAHVSDDANLQLAFAQGKDIHRATASEVFGTPLDEVTAEQRRAAKAINFGLIYGMGAFGLASNLGITRDAAQSYIDRYFERYPGVATYMDLTRAKANEQGYVETVFGRRLWLPEIKGAKGPRKAAAERAAINAPMQGTAADLIKMAMVAVQEWIEKENLKTMIIMQVHDELVLEVPQDEVDLVKSRLPELMCGVAELKVPLVAEVGMGPNWEQAH